MEYLNVSALSIVTGKNRETVTKRLNAAGLVARKNGASHEYKTPEAVRAILAPELATGVDGENAKMILDKYKAEKIKIEVDTMRGDLVPVVDVLSFIKNKDTVVRSAILNFPGLVYHAVSSGYQVEAVREANKLSRQLCDQIVSDLGEFNKTFNGEG